ncbi:unnamed protein product [Dibothriocephalus latus]|uniref:Uncharacterized protein n=1 Tax=Dibothriocephalus latus TaxID=60516 RepID=A0A3P7S4L8_DIBLA|nr:unnamed protein product [Dibothriocephalus latus]
MLRMILSPRDSTLFLLLFLTRKLQRQSRRSGTRLKRTRRV